MSWKALLAALAGTLVILALVCLAAARKARLYEDRTLLNLLAVIMLIAAVWLVVAAVDR